MLKNHKITDRWVGGGCGFIQICQQSGDINQRRYLQLRKDYVKRLNKLFLHSFVTFDPLVSPLVNHLKRMGIETVASCQGNEDRASYIYFTGGMESVKYIHSLIVSFHRKTNGGWWWENAIIAYEGEREKSMWLLQFYDTLAMMYFTHIVFDESFKPTTFLDMAEYDYKKDYTTIK